MLLYCESEKKLLFSLLSTDIISMFTFIIFSQEVNNEPGFWDILDIFKGNIAFRLSSLF